MRAASRGRLLVGVFSVFMFFQVALVLTKLGSVRIVVGFIECRDIARKVGMLALELVGALL
jgi:hypothetical protein